MPKVTGVGGVFFKSADTAAARQWFTDKLGVPMQSWGTMFPWRDAENPEREGCTVLSAHAADSSYFDPSPHPFMINLIVDDLDAMLAQLKDQGVEPVRTFEPDAQGKFAHVMGPDGVKIELWEPADG